MAKQELDKQGPIIGGSTLLGLGVGFLLLEQSALYFTASIMIGIGIGIIASQFVAKK